MDYERNIWQKILQTVCVVVVDNVVVDGRLDGGCGGGDGGDNDGTTAALVPRASVTCQIYVSFYFEIEHKTRAQGR